MGSRLAQHFELQAGPSADSSPRERVERLRKRLPDVLKVPPISLHGNVSEIASLFGGSARLGEAVTTLQNLLYAA